MLYFCIQYWDWEYINAFRIYYSLRYVIKELYWTCCAGFLLALWVNFVGSMLNALSLVSNASQMKLPRTLLMTDIYFVIHQTLKIVYLCSHALCSQKKEKISFKISIWRFTMWEHEQEIQLLVLFCLCSFCPVCNS